MICSYCAGDFEDAAIVCKHCCRDLFVVRPLMGRLAETTTRLEVPEATDRGEQLIVGAAATELLTSSFPTVEKSPLAFKVRLPLRNDAAIDRASVKLIYLKLKPAARIKRHLPPDGIDMDQADISPGTHVLRLDLKDQQGRFGTAIIKLVMTGM
jgi:hypothetical protein